MRRTVIPLLVGAFFVAAVGSLEAQALRIGYIQSQEILAAHPGTAEAQAKLEQEGQAAEEEMQRQASRCMDCGVPFATWVAH